MEVGDRFNRFVVVGFEKKNKREQAVVQCDCGYKGTRRIDHLESGRTQMCKRCSSKETAKNYPMPRNYKAVGDLGATYLGTLKRGAEKRGLSWEVSQEYLWSIFTGRCALTGRSINLSLETLGCVPKYSAFNASLDRIDSSLGYVEGNVQWVHKDINRLKNNYKQEYFIEMCNEVTRYANQQPSSEMMQ